jgi:hypothetical protein
MGTPQLQSVFPLLADECRTHGIPRPEELKNIRLLDQSFEPLIPDLAGAKVDPIAQVPVPQRVSIALYFLHDVPVSVRVRGKNLAIGRGAVALH